MSRLGWQPLTTAGAPIGLQVADGPGAPVVLVHGVEDGWRSWGQLAELLGERHRVYALDLPWRAGGDYRWALEADAGAWLRRALDLVPERNFRAVGHSFGATALMQVLAAGAQASARLTAVVLLAPAFRVPRTPVGPDVEARERERLRAVIDERIRLRAAERNRQLDRGLRRRMVDHAVARIGGTGLRTLFAHFAATGHLALSGVTVPTFALAGTDDPAFTADRAEALALAMPTATVRRLSQLSHFCHVQQAAQVAEEIGSFFDAVSGCTRSLWALTSQGGNSRDPRI
ncbi:alpha/beta fold hydrolase [Salinispora vitiensis]|uniref:alpha/beta fold hydrolase n=1 Tax=Salinispora vitiensis TaxID=999544 RepID=UPI0013A54FC4|nr:alpha/beta hydrolase [Salinispora vitiensis]